MSILGIIENKSRRGHLRVRWMNGVKETTNMGLQKLCEVVLDRTKWRRMRDRRVTRCRYDMAKTKTSSILGYAICLGTVSTISSAIDLDALVRQCPDKLRCVTCENLCTGPKILCPAEFLCNRIRALELKYSPGGANRPRNITMCCHLVSAMNDNLLGCVHSCCNRFLRISYVAQRHAHVFELFHLNQLYVSTVHNLYCLCRSP